jgi:thioredoxin-related protein
MIKKLLFSLSLLFCFSMNSQVLNWNLDVVNAIPVSNKERKPMLLLFTDNKSNIGALEAQIFSTLDFALWSRDNVVLVKLDLTDDPSNNYLERNLSLKKAFGVQELPAICYSKADIRKDKINYQLLGKTGYRPGGVKSWIANSVQLLREPSE